MAVNARCLTLSVVAMPTAQGNAVRTEFVWDPTESIATRPLVMRAKNWGLNLFYTHDGNKNVSEVFYHALQNGIAAHYDYAPFGAVTRTSSATRVTNRDLISENPFRFSSEYHDDMLQLVYYNYREASLLDGRWTSRERREENEERNLYLLLSNSVVQSFDYLGDSRQPTMPETATVYPYPSLAKLQKYSCGSQYVEGPQQTLPEGECCVPDLDGMYSIIFIGENYPDSNPEITKNEDGTTHVIPRRLRIGAVCIQKIITICLSARTYQMNTYLIDGKSAIWEEKTLEDAQIKF